MSANYQQYRDLARELAAVGETSLAQWINITVAMGGPHVAEELSQGLAQRMGGLGKLPSHISRQLNNLAADAEAA